MTKVLAPLGWPKAAAVTPAASLLIWAVTVSALRGAPESLHSAVLQGHACDGRIRPATHPLNVSICADCTVVITAVQHRLLLAEAELAR
jgi:hypothetical protein